MHEMSIAMEIYEICSQSVASRRPGRLTVIRLAVGELSAVEPELLHYAWEALTAETPDAGSRLEIDWHPAVQVCPECGVLGKDKTGGWIPLCPDCLKSLRVEGGDELDIVEVTFTPKGSDLEC